VMLLVSGIFLRSKPEDGDDLIIRNVCVLLPDLTAFQHRRFQLSYSLPSESQIQNFQICHLTSACNLMLITYRVEGALLNYGTINQIRAHASECAQYSRTWWRGGVRRDDMQICHHCTCNYSGRHGNKLQSLMPLFVCSIVSLH
jgi:hypothetical protein